MALEKDISQNAHTLGAVSDLVAETGHSILRVHQWQNANVVVKRCRQDSGAQAAERFRNEVTALMVVKAHVWAIYNIISFVPALIAILLGQCSYDP